jgi:hypothetical protein
LRERLRQQLNVILETRETAPRSCREPFRCTF